MKVFRCIFCNQLLDDDHISKEHIIPQCMGGKLNSNDLICRDCNSRFGTKFDESLIERYGLILHPIRLFNPGIKIKDIEVEHKGIKYLLTKNGIKLKDPYPITGEGGFLDVTFPDIDSLRRHLQRMKRKNPKIDIEANIEAAKVERTEINEHFDFQIKEIDEEVYWCCGKICYEFLYYIMRDYQPSSSLFRDFIMGELETTIKNPICIWFSKYDPLPTTNESLFHMIVLEGRKEERILIGYLKVFDCLPLLMVIDYDYEGPSFCKGYFQNLLENTQDQFLPTDEIPLSRSEIIQKIETYDPLEVGDIYVKTVFYTLDKSRIIPIKREIEALESNINLEEFSNKLELMDYVYKELLLILDKYGLLGIIKNSLERVDEFLEESAFLDKISKIFEFLIPYFVKTKLNTEVLDLIFDKIT